MMSPECEYVKKNKKMMSKSINQSINSRGPTQRISSLVVFTLYRHSAAGVLWLTRKKVDAFRRVKREPPDVAGSSPSHVISQDEPVPIYQAG